MAWFLIRKTSVSTSFPREFAVPEWGRGFFQVGRLEALSRLEWTPEIRPFPRANCSAHSGRESLYLPNPGLRSAGAELALG